ncbi:MAG TPA: nucleoside triphosphate pyrophosphohydrolase [Gemmataceae bacterium]|jgi:MazG family protein|nr:nucleoside triphosphate pyrophosphohydrolase [Gemmataceae bacterium]
MDIDEAARMFREFVAVIKRLRTPETGCPWDLEQDHRTLRPFLIEEAYEVLDAIDRGDDPAFREELGDLLLQVVLHAQVADDRGAFSIIDVIRGVERKMVRRHPHVFGPVKAAGSAEVLKNWDQIKAAEAAEKGLDTSPAAALARLPETLPALQRAQRLGEKAAKAGMGGDSLATLLAKVNAAFAEFERDIQSHAVVSESEPASVTAAKSMKNAQCLRLGEALGDVLFQICQLARLLGLSAEDSLRASNRRFIERFRTETR